MARRRKLLANPLLIAMAGSCVTRMPRDDMRTGNLMPPPTYEGTVCATDLPEGGVVLAPGPTDARVLDPTAPSDCYAFRTESGELPVCAGAPGHCDRCTQVALEPVSDGWDVDLGRLPTSLDLMPVLSNEACLAVPPVELPSLEEARAKTASDWAAVQEAPLGSPERQEALEVFVATHGGLWVEIDGTARVLPELREAVEALR